eukprot:gene30937-38787_t
MQGTDHGVQAVECVGYRLRVTQLREPGTNCVQLSGLSFTFLQPASPPGAASDAELGKQVVAAAQPLLQLQEVLARRLEVPEKLVAASTSRLQARLRSEVPVEARTALAERDRLETAELERGPSSASDDDLPGRQSGSVQWRTQRGEMGPGSAGTAWAVCGAGRVRASGQHEGGFEVAANLFDGRPNTKWLDFGGAGGKETWVEWQSMGGSAMRLGSYALTSGNDCPERDPSSFTLEGQAAQGAPWEPIDAQSSVLFDGRLQRREFAVVNQ